MDQMFRKTFTSLIILLFIFSSPATATINNLDLETHLDEIKFKSRIISNSATDTIIPNQTQNATPTVFKLLTYNLLESGVFPKWRDVVIEENADIALFGETGGWAQYSIEDEEFVSDLKYINDNLEAKGIEPYTYIDISIEPTTTTGGAVILSRFPILDSFQINSYPLDDGTEQVFNHDLFHVIVNISNVEVNIIGSVHWACCDYPDRREKRDLDMEAALNYIDDQGPVPFIFTGDFNTYSPQDAALRDSPGFEWWSDNLETTTLDQLLNPNNPRTTKKHKWIDVFRTLNPKTPGATFQSDFYISRLDYIFVNEFFFDKLISSTAGGTQYDDVGSDHYNVDVIINMNPELADLRPPFPVYEVETTVNSLSELSFTWEENGANDTDYYNFYVNDKIIATPKETKFVDSNVEQKIINKFEITATDLNNNSGFGSVPVYYDSNYGIFTTPRKPVISGEEREGQIYISWTLDDDGGTPLLHYLLFRATEESIKDDFFIITNRADKSLDTEWIEDISRTENKYYFKVLGVNMLGRGIFSETIELSALGPEDSEKKGLAFPNLATFLTLFLLVPVVIKYRKNKK